MKKLLYILLLSIFAVQVMAQDEVILKFVDQEGKPLLDQTGKEITDTLETKYIEILPTLKNLYDFQETVGQRGGNVDKSNIIPLQISYQNWRLFKELLPLAYDTQILEDSIKGSKLIALLKLKSLNELIDLAKTALYLGQEKLMSIRLKNNYEPLNIIISIIELHYGPHIQYIEDEQVRYEVLKLQKLRDRYRASETLI